MTAVRDSVVVAMSGGVDSSAAACLLLDAGYDIVGVAMQVWDYKKNNGNSRKATCCAPADFDDAREVADRRGFPFYVFDFEDSFQEAVINPFVNAYLQGYTPNPCVECNRKVKFKELRRRAESLGRKFVATGHYAQIKPKSAGKLGLFTSKDRAKDQSYFLYAMTQEELASTLFPVGAMTKDQVRRYLNEDGHAIANKDESQDICFVASSVPEFVESHAGVSSKVGPLVLKDGTKIGTHEGVHHFTVGQRKGLGGGAAKPLYVLNIDPESNTVRVGDKEDLKRESFTVFNVNWVSGEVPTEPLRVLARLRYRHPGELCEVVAEGDRATLRFVDGWTAVSPGQSAVFYSTEPDSDGDYEVLGGGIIER